MKVVIFIAMGMPHLDPPPSYYEKLKKSFPHVTFAIIQNPKDIPSELADADVLFAPLITDALLADAPKLKWFHGASNQFTQFQTDAVFRSDLTITNSRGAFAPIVSENVIGAALFLSHRMDTAKGLADLDRKPGAMSLMATQRLRGKTMGIAGLGANGRAVASIAKALGMKVIATKRNAAVEKPNSVDELLPPSELQNLLQRIQVLVLTVPHTVETDKLIGEATVNALPSTAIIINASLPPIVDDTAVIDALKKGRLFGYACSDLLPQDSPLRTAGLGTVAIFPHAGPGDKQFWSGVFSLFAENLKRYLKGQKMLNPMNRELKY